MEAATPSELTYDLIIAGGGPAGSACAITAARSGFKVLVLEKDKLPRHKVCGEFVSSESLALLDSLMGRHGQQSPARSAAPEIASARFEVGPKSIAFPISPPARSITRFDLDEGLLRSARNCGVRVEEGVTVRAVTANGLFQVDTTAAAFTAKAVVNATGRWSQLTRFSGTKPNVWIGLKAHFRETNPSLSVDLYFFPGGYCGVTPVGENMVNACAMVRAGAAKTMEEVLAKHPALWKRSRSWETCFHPISTSPLYFRKPQTCSNGMILAGDSAGFIDPFAGDGISLALQSGSLAARSLRGFLSNTCSWDESHREYRSVYLAKLAPAFRYAGLVRSLLFAPSWVQPALVTLAAAPPIARWFLHATRARTAG